MSMLFSDEHDDAVDRASEYDNMPTWAKLAVIFGIVTSAFSVVVLCAIGAFVQLTQW